MSFVDIYPTLDIDKDVTNLPTISENDVNNALNAPNKSLKHFLALISPAATPQLETLAQNAATLTRQRFGHTIQLFIPLYLSNICYNNCTYCGFSINRKYTRITLSDPDILKQAEILSAKGFKHILLLTGEAPGTVDIPYIKNAITLLKPHFSSIGLEVQPFNTSQYETLIQAGADSLTLYQETYHKPTYATHHLSGKKKHFENRLDAADQAGKARFQRLNIGALFGLTHWQYDAIALAHHLFYLQKKYWQTKFALSFPRIQDEIGGFKPSHPLSDTHLVQLICAFRLTFPDVGITLSTREPQTLRNNLIPLGITSISAESDTSPGGYSGKKSENQFEISDKRSLEEIKALLIQHNLDPVMKDWDPLT